MRIIAGSFKGRRLLSPDNRRIRPTQGRVKEAMFSMIAPYVNGATVIDLFSGTGSLGLEALSRGAETVYFGDKSKESLAVIIKNIDLCRASDRSLVLQGDWRNILHRIGGKADIILLDPPYKEISILDVIYEIDRLNILYPSGIIVAEHDGKQVLPEIAGRYVKEKERGYGAEKITLYTEGVKEN
jgi:16S rRNA (guanine966-N2)-methyltransferase